MGRTPVCVNSTVYPRIKQFAVAGSSNRLAACFRKWRVVPRTEQHAGKPPPLAGQPALVTVTSRSMQRQNDREGQPAKQEDTAIFTAAWFGPMDPCHLTALQMCTVQHCFVLQNGTVASRDGPLGTRAALDLASPTVNRQRGAPQQAPRHAMERLAHRQIRCMDAWMDGCAMPQPGKGTVYFLGRRGRAHHAAPAASLCSCCFPSTVQAEFNSLSHPTLLALCPCSSRHA